MDNDEVMCGGVGAGVGCWLPRPLLGDGGGAESGDESSEKRVSLPLSMFDCTHNRPDSAENSVKNDGIKKKKKKQAYLLFFYTFSVKK